VNGVRPLALILAALAVCMALASMWPHLAGGQASMPAEVAEGAVLQQDCDRDDDVSVTAPWVVEGVGYTLEKDPPDYADGDDIRIYYDVENSSCHEVSVTVALTGSVSGATIHISDATSETCRTECTIEAGGTLRWNDGWDLGKHPNATGEKVIATVTVTAPDGFVDANPENNSATSTQAINIVNEVPDPAPDITVKSVTASADTVVVGETITFTVTVQNEGDADADTKVVLDHGVDTTELDSATVSALADGPEKTVTLSWDTHGSDAGEHRLRVLAQTEGDDNADNDSETVTVTLVEPSVDVAVKSVTASVTDAVVGETVDFTVTLENGGNVPAPWPQVSLFDANAAEDAEPLASKQAENSIDASETATVTVSWDTDEAEAGTYSLRVVATAANDDDSTNDSSTASLTLHNPVDVGVSFTYEIASSVVLGNTVAVEFTLTNTGQHDTGEVKVSLYVRTAGDEPGDPQLADTKIVSAVVAGAPTTGAFNWDTADVAVGHYELKLVAATFGDTDATNNTVSTGIEIRNWLVLKNVAPETADAVTGDTVEFTAQVENVGTDELTDVTVGLYESLVSTPLRSTTITSIAAGNTASATIEWDTADQDVGQVELFVAAGANDQDPDGDDSQSANVTIRNPIALSSAVPASTDHVAGLPVTINVQVLNESNAEVTDVAVDLFVEDSEDADDSTTIESIAAGENVATYLTWDASDVEPGDHELKIVASLAGYDSDANDESSMTVTLRRPVMAVALTTATINRNVAAIGQTLDVTATITNHSEVPVAVPVSLYTVQDLHDTTVVASETSPRIEPGSSEAATLTWDTTGKPSGTYDLKVAVDLPGDTTPDDNTGALTIELFHSAFDGDDAPESCLEDVRVTVDEVRDITGQQRSPPDYRVGENLRIVYTVYNYSCDTDVAAAIAMTGPNDRPISDAKAPCFSNCTVPFGGKAEGEIAWTIPTLPAFSDQPITATVTVLSPNDFADVHEANNSAASTDRINVVHPDDILLDLGEEKGNKVSARRTLAGPEFGTVDVRLVSVDPLQTALPFTAETVEFVVEAANEGPTAEPVSVRFLLTPEDGMESREIYRHTMVIAAGQTRTVTVEAPLRDVLPGVHTIEVLLSAAVDLSLNNNTQVIEITRQEPLVNLEVMAVSISPEPLFLGDEAAVALTMQNNSDIALPLTMNLFLDDTPQTPANQDLGELAAGAQLEKTITWKLPAAGKYLGQHTLKLALTSTEYGRVVEVSRNVTLHINAEIVGISTSPQDTAMQGEEVVVKVEVQNNGPATANVPVTLNFPPETRSPETRRPSVPPGSTETARFTWKTRDYSVGKHMLAATVPDQHNIASGETSMELPFRVSPLAVTATIVDISVYPTAPMVGEPVSIAMTVRNDGPVATRIPITLHFPPGGRQPDSKKPHLDPGEAGTVVFEWRTGNFRPGTHRFRAELAAVNSPQRHFTVDLLPTVENVAIVGMGTYPADTAMVGEPVEVWIDVRNDGPLAVNVPVRLTFPSTSKQPERQSPRIEPYETLRVDFEWRTSNYQPGDHTLTAAILLDDNITLGRTTEEIRFALTPLIINATIVDIAVNPETPHVGEPATITVTVRNDGRVAANIPVTLHFPSEDKQPETRSPRVDPGHAGTATFDWLTGNYSVGTHQFSVELVDVDVADQIFTVDLLSPVESVVMVGMGTYPAGAAMVGEPVEVWIDVRNDGPVAINVPVRLTFPSASKRPETSSPRVGPSETARVSFDWKTSNYDAGVHTLRAAILLDDNVTVGQTSGELRFVLTPLVVTATILEVAVSPEFPRVGDLVSITVSVRNEGRMPVNIPIALHFPLEDKQLETRRPRIDAGATGAASFTWRTGRQQPGPHAFIVEVAGDPPSTHQFTVELLPPIVNVAIVGMGSDPSDTAVGGQTVKIWIDVVNNGPSALNVPVRLSFPSSDKQPERKSPRIEPGETARVEFAWKTGSYDPGVHALTATLLAEYNTTELNTTATIQIRLISPRLIASIVNVSWSPDSPVVGEPVDITVRVRNDGLVTSSIPITLHFPSGDKQPETRRPRVARGGFGLADFTWRTSRYEPGDHVFRVQIPGVAGAVRTFEIELRPPEVDFAVVDVKTPDPLHPIVKGDWVEITAVVQNRGPYAGRGTVYLLDAANLDTMYEQSASLEPGESRELQFIWKTLRYPVGEYELLVRVDAEHDTDPENDRSDHARVHLLTDRDITVGFGNKARPAVFAEPTSEADLSAIAWYHHDIVVVGNSQTPLGRPVATPSNPPMGVSPKPTGGNYDPARMYWRWRAAQKSPWECVRFQRTVGENLPRAVICPRAPALVR